MKAVLKPAELLYQAINRGRRSLYRSGTLEPRRLARPVISIGNISAGGSGKTPLTITVTGILLNEGLKVVILTRGYGRSGKDEWALVDSNDSRRFGDEPVLLASRLPEATVIVGRNRHAAGAAFLEVSDCDVFVLDDGFQHLQLHRDLDIVIDDPDARWNREGRDAIADAGITITRASSENHPAPDGSFIAVLVPSAVRRSGDRFPMEKIRGLRCVAMAGLARNDRFFTMLENAGVHLAKAWSFPDHHQYSASDLAAVESSRVAAGAEMIVTTEKDAVKLPEDFDCSIIEVVMKIIPEELFRSRLAGKIRSKGRSPLG